MTIATKHRINVVLTMRQYKALKALAEHRGETVATLIRECINLGLGNATAWRDSLDSTLPKQRTGKP